MAPELISLARRLATDWSLAVAVTAIELSKMFVFDAGGSHDPLDVALLLASSLPLIVWRRRPFLCLQVTGWATIALAARGAAHIGLGPLAGTFAVACWSATRSRQAAAASLLVLIWLVPLLTADRRSIATNVALYGAAWLLGAMTRERRVQHGQLQARTRELAREREEKAALAADGERARIARELHDLLTHSVSVMVIQAQGAQASSTEPARVMMALKRIETIGQQTLSELRILLRGAHFEDDVSREPQPGLNGVPGLVQAVRTAGLDVVLDHERTAATVPASVQLSAYRIVQEALTNTLRHSQATRAWVSVHLCTEELVVEILDEGPAATTDATTAASDDGRGIAGMRARAASVGGTLLAQRGPGGGFEVTARLPVV